MTTQQAVKHFGSKSALARALDAPWSTVASWGHYPPALRQIQLERITNHVLTAEPNLFKRRAA